MTHFPRDWHSSQRASQMRGKGSSHSSIHLQLTPWRRTTSMFKHRFHGTRAEQAGNWLRLASKPLVRICSKLAVSLVSEGSSHIGTNSGVHAHPGPCWPGTHGSAMLQLLPMSSLTSPWLLSSCLKRAEIVSCSYCDFKNLLQRL